MLQTILTLIRVQLSAVDAECNEVLLRAWIVLLELTGQSPMSLHFHVGLYQILYSYSILLE